jgi:hypothetical protein
MVTPVVQQALIGSASELAHTKAMLHTCRAGAPLDRLIFDALRRCPRPTIGQSPAPQDWRASLDGDFRGAAGRGGDELRQSPIPNPAE